MTEGKWEQLELWPEIDWEAQRVSVEKTCDCECECCGKSTKS